VKIRTIRGEDFGGIYPKVKADVIFLLGSISKDLSDAG